MNTPKSEIHRRVDALREEMKKAGIQAYLVPGTDPHQSEYPPEHFHCRHWLSGFYGSAGTVVVTQEAAGLWTDSRYFLEAEERLADTPIDLFKLDTPGTPTYTNWLAEVLQSGDTLSFDARLVTPSTLEALRNTLGDKGVFVRPGPDLLAPIWDDRPALPAAPVYLHEEKYAGESASTKIERLRAAVSDAGANSILLTALDDIAWILNIRGSDVGYNPVAMAYLLVTRENLTLFIDEAKVAPDTRIALEKLGVSLTAYRRTAEALGALGSETTLLVDPAQINCALSSALSEEVEQLYGDDPVVKMKARKNQTQAEGIREAMRRDGSALLRFFRWLEGEVTGDNRPREREIGDMLRTFRAEEKLFVSEAFNTIAGYGPNGAIVHYAPPAEGSAEIGRDTLLLLDSGGQYLDGTTDITRTVCFGEPTDQQREDYTAVLQGHIALGTTPFPKGTTGHQLDSLARQHLWRHYANYGHGTGHGVGHFLNVHEGPQKISQRDLGVALEEGMVLSNEPGVYRNGKYGIRIENLVLVREAGSHGFDEFLEFETVTLFPYERKLIAVDMLTEEERGWIDEYHRRVLRELSPLLNEEARQWLEAKCAPL